MTEDAFTLPPDGMLSEQITLPAYRLALGLLHIDGAGLRVCAWDGERLRHMSQAAARRLAKSLAGEGLGPVVGAIERLVGRVDEIEASVAAARAQRFAEMPVEGCA